MQNYMGAPIRAFIFGESVFYHQLSSNTPTEVEISRVDSTLENEETKYFLSNGSSFSGPPKILLIGEYVIIAGYEVSKFRIDKDTWKKIVKISRYTDYVENRYGYAYFSTDKMDYFVGTDFVKFIEEKYHRDFVVHLNCPVCGAPIAERVFDIGVEGDPTGVLTYGAMCDHCGEKCIEVDEEMEIRLARVKEYPRYHPPNGTSPKEQG